METLGTLKLATGVARRLSLARKRERERERERQREREREKERLSLYNGNIKRLYEEVPQLDLVYKWIHAVQPYIKRKTDTCTCV